MAVIIKQGNIFEAETQVITDANNSIGVSAAGLAYAFAKRYPILTERYNDFCKKGQERYMLLHKTDRARFFGPLIYKLNACDNHDYAICKFPTMTYPGEVAQEKNIMDNLSLLEILLDNYAYESIALPALGCGIGRYSFEKLEEQIREIFDNGRFTIHLYRPN